jgi:hypothetical protein
LFYRCHYFTDGTIQAILSAVRPPVFRSSSTEFKNAHGLVDSLMETIIKGHTRLATHFLNNTKYGREFRQLLDKNRRLKAKRPELDLDKITDTLALPVGIVRALWYPLASVVSPSLWEEKDSGDSDEQDSEYAAETDTPTISRFRILSAKIVMQLALLWSEAKQEINSHGQITIFKQLTPLATSSIGEAHEWPQPDFSQAALRHFRKGVYKPTNLDSFLEKSFARIFGPQDSEETNEGEDKDSDDVEPPVEPRQTQNTMETEAAGTQSMTETSSMQETQSTQETHSTQETSHASNAESLATQNPGSTDTPAVDIRPGSPITIVDDDDDVTELDRIEVVGRPITFGSEFEESGGRGLGDKAMAEVMEVDDNSRGDVVRAFDTTISSVVETRYLAEEGIAMSTMTAKGLAKYAVLRLAREQEAINDAIWRLNEILRENQSEVAELNVLIRKEEEKHRFLADLNTKVTDSFDEVDERRAKLDKMTGQDRDSEGASRGMGILPDTLAQRPRKDHPKPAIAESWRDRVQQVQQAAMLRVQWRTTVPATKPSTAESAKDDADGI